MIEDVDRRRLEEGMDERRAELGLRWREVAAAAGLTYEGLRGVRKGPSKIPAFTRRGLERALKWSTGQVDRMLGEGDSLSDPTDDEIIAMTHRQVLTHERKIAAAHGEQAAEDWLYHAVIVRRDAARQSRD